MSSANHIFHVKPTKPPAFELETNLIPKALVRAMEAGYRFKAE